MVVSCPKCGGDMMPTTLAVERVVAGVPFRFNVAGRRCGRGDSSSVDEDASQATDGAVMDDNYFCRSTTTTSAGRPPS